MGLLDELRQEADSRKSAAQREAEQKARLAEFFRTTLSPKVLQIYRYLYELGEHLNELKPDVTVPYLFPTMPQPVALRQGNYQVRSDTQHATQETHETTIMFECTRAHDILFSVEKPREIARIERLLYDYGLEFHCRKIKNDRFEVISGEFIIKPRVPVGIRFTADIPHAAIQLQISNFDGFGIRQHTLKPDKVNEEFLDDFGHYLLRRKPDFMRLEISDEERERLRERIALAKEREAEELQDITEVTVQENDDKETLLSQLFKR